MLCLTRRKAYYLPVINIMQGDLHDKQCIRSSLPQLHSAFHFEILYFLTEQQKSDIMESLHKRNNTANRHFETNEGERALLCSNKSSNRSPSLDFNPNSPLISEEVLLDQLASILVKGFLAQKNRDQ